MRADNNPAASPSEKPAPRLSSYARQLIVDVTGMFQRRPINDLHAYIAALESVAFETRVYCADIRESFHTTEEARLIAVIDSLDADAL